MGMEYIMNGKQVRVWKETVVAYMKVLSRYSLEKWR